jgi:ACR3 family arsenite efflux pump ArsB
MSNIDWIVLLLTLLITIAYGVYKSKATKNLDGYFLGNRSLPWYLVLLSIMEPKLVQLLFYRLPDKLIQTECVLFNITLDCPWQWLFCASHLFRFLEN